MGGPRKIRGQNSGIEPAVVAAARGAPIQVYRATPRVLAGTKGVSHAVTVRPRDLAGRGRGRFGVALHKTTAIGPEAATSQPKREPNKPSDVPPPARRGEPESPSKPHRGIISQTPPPAMLRHGTRAPGTVTHAPPPAQVSAPVTRPVEKPEVAPVAKPVVKPVSKSVTKHVPATVVHAPSHRVAAPPRKPVARPVVRHAKPLASPQHPPAKKHEFAKRPPPAKKPPPQKKRKPGEKPDRKN